ncbi:Ig-like domain-containing protein [Alphaproteobacteria bacterium]|nr:Ig-like domain-containing protein [Alphaproteobacteria bacterium]
MISKPIYKILTFITILFTLLFSSNILAATLGNSVSSCVSGAHQALTNFEVMTKLTLPSGATSVTDIHARVDTNGGKWKLILAEDNSGAPGTVLKQSGELTASSGIVTKTFSSAQSVSGSDVVWVGAKNETNTQGICSETSSVVGSSHYKTQSDYANYTSIATGGHSNWTSKAWGIWITYTDAPSMTITSTTSGVTDGSTTNDSSIALTFTTSAGTMDFAVGDISVSGGSLSNFAASSSTVYTATFTPSGSGATTIDVAANSWSDGTTNATAADQFNWTYDGTLPTTSSLSPADNATGVAVDANLVLTLTENAVAGSGNLTIHKTSDDSTVETIAIGSASISSAAVTFNPTSDLTANTEYYVLLASTALDDSVGNSFAGISSTTAWSFTTLDNINPTLTSASPADNATSVAIDSDIVLTFSEAVDGESGNVTIIKTSDSSTAATMACGSVSGGGTSTLTFNPSSDLSYSTAYHVLIPATCVDDAASNSFAGISSATVLNFTTAAADSTAPTLSSSSPADNATGVAVDSNIVLTFSESVDAESGNIVIYNSGGTAVETIAVTDAEVSGSGSNTITINPSSDLQNGTSYYVQIAATGFDDTASNSYAGITNTTDLSFTTVSLEAFDKTTRGIIDSQTTMATGNIRESLQTVNSRLSIIRDLENNLSRQGIQVAFDVSTNSSVNEMMTLIGSKLVHEEENLFENNWAVWSEGTITYGRVGSESGILGQEVRSDALTIGVDKKLPDDRIIGVALHGSWRAVEIGSTAEVDNTIVSVTSYGSQKLSKDTFVDVSLGFSQMHIDTDRVVTGGKNAGDRDGQQIYGSAAYTMKPDLSLQKDINLNYFSRLDLGYTFLDNYTESGLGTTSLSYEEDHITNGTLSIGSNINKTFTNQKGLFIPFANVELGGSVVRNGISEAYYNSNSSSISAYKSSADGTNIHTNLEFGMKANLSSSWNMDLKINQYNNNNNESAQNLSAMFNRRF